MSHHNREDDSPKKTALTEEEFEAARNRAQRADEEAASYEAAGSLGLQKDIDKVKHATPILGGIPKPTVTSKMLADKKLDLNHLMQNRPQFYDMTLNDDGNLAVRRNSYWNGQQMVEVVETYCVDARSMPRFIEWLQVVFEVGDRKEVQTVEELVEFMKQFRSLGAIVTDHPKLRDALDTFIAEMGVAQ